MVKLGKKKGGSVLKKKSVLKKSIKKTVVKSTSAKKKNNSNNKGGWKKKGSGNKGSGNWRNNSWNNKKSTGWVKIPTTNRPAAPQVEGAFATRVCVQDRYVGMLIGKKGTGIKSMAKETEAQFTFDKDTFVHMGEKLCLVTITGNAEQISDGCRLVAERISEFAQAEELRKIWFCVERDILGMVIGKKWANLAQVKGSMDNDVHIDIVGGKDDHFEIKGIHMRLISIFGPSDECDSAIGRYVELIERITEEQRRNGRMMGLTNPDETEVGLCVPKRHVGGIIGEKGKTINKIRRETGIRVVFGDDSFKNANGVDSIVICVFGTKDQIAAGCGMIAEKLSNIAMSLECMLTFMVTKDWVGMVIGKKGKTIQEIKGAGKGVWADVSKEDLKLPGGMEISTLTISGPRKTVGASFGKAVWVLGEISKLAKKEAAEAK